MEENNTNVESVKVKKKGVSVVLVVLFFIIGIVLGVGGYYLYNNLLGDNKCDSPVEVDNTSKEEEVSYDAKSLFIKKLIDRYAIDSLGEDRDLLFQKDKTDIASLDSQYLKVFAVNNLNTGAKALSSFTKDDLESSYDELFTKDIPLTHEDIMIDRCFIYHYDAATSVYNYQTGVEGCGGTTDYQLQYSPVDVRFSDDKLEVDVAVAYVFYDTAFKDRNSSIKIADKGYNPTNLFVIDDYKEQLNKFTFNFTYNKSKLNYTLDDIELVR